MSDDFPDDIALASWTILEGNSRTTDDEKARLLDSCNAKELGSPSIVEAPQ